MSTATGFERYAELTPAYGRQYKNVPAVKLSFAQGQDFILNTFHGSGLCSIRDAKVGDVVQLRFNDNRKVTTFTVTQAHLDALQVTK